MGSDVKTMDRKRARKGTGIGRMSGHHTAASLAAEEAIRERKKLNAAQAKRVGMIVASMLPDDHPFWNEAIASDNADPKATEESESC